MTREVSAVAMCRQCSFFKGVIDEEPTLSMNGKDYYAVECEAEECPAGDVSAIPYPIPPIGNE